MESLTDYCEIARRVFYAGCVLNGTCVKIFGSDDPVNLNSRFDVDETLRNEIPGIGEQGEHFTTLVDMVTELASLAESHWPRNKEFSTAIERCADIAQLEMAILCLANDIDNYGTEYAKKEEQLVPEFARAI